MKTDFEDLSLEQKILLLSATSWMSQNDKDTLKSLLHEGKFSWRKILSEAKQHHIVPLLYATFRELDAGFIDEEVLLNIKGSYKSVKFINTILTSELSKLQRQLSDYHTKVIVLKGLALVSTIYDDLGFRYIGDIDILAKPADWHLINETLHSRGYVGEKNFNLLKPTELRDYTLTFRTLNFQKHGLMDFKIDLHFNPIHIGNIEDTDLWMKMMTMQQEDTEIHCLCPEHQLAHLCVHLNHHSYALLKWFVDIYALLHKYQEILDWNYIAKKFRNTGTGVSIYYGLMLTTELFGNCAVPDWVTNHLAPSTLTKRVFECTWDTQDIAPLSGKNSKHLNFRMTMMLTEKLQDKYRYIKNSVVPPLRWLRCRYNDSSSKKAYRLYLSHFRDLMKGGL